MEQLDNADSYHMKKRKVKKESWRQINRKKKKMKEQEHIFEAKTFQKHNDVATTNRTEEQDTTVDVVPNTASSSSRAGRAWTLSIAVPGQIMENAQSQELKAHLAGQIARAAAVFCADEVIIFDENAGMTKDDLHDSQHPCVHMSKILEYLECPQYLRRYMFPLMPALRFAGLLAPLDTPNHLRADDFSIPFREVVTLKKLAKDGSWACAGINRDVLLNEVLAEDVRKTVKLDLDSLHSKIVKAEVVDPSTPRLQLGIYWGYRVRIARSFSAIFSDSVFDGEPYDLKIGTSDKGKQIRKALPLLRSNHSGFKHALIVFGGLAGIEASVENDESIDNSAAEDLFHFYLNTCPTQGTRTIRTEEAILISLARLKSVFEKLVK